VGSSPALGTKGYSGAGRKRRDEAREKLAAGIDPGTAKRAEKRAARVAAANSFEVVAHGWMEERKTAVEIGQYEKTLARFKNDVLPRLPRPASRELEALAI
jgi:hypothetical protein